MKTKIQNKYLTKAFSTALATTSLSMAANVSAEENPFQITNLPGGYMIAEEKAQGQMPPDADAQREGSGKGCNKLASGQCGEGQCGTNAKDDCADGRFDRGCVATACTG